MWNSLKILIQLGIFDLEYSIFKYCLFSYKTCAKNNYFVTVPSSMSYSIKCKEEKIIIVKIITNYSI